MTINEYHGKKKAPSSSQRVCAVCKQKHGAVFPFPGTLAYHGIKGQLATVDCIRKLACKSVQEVSDGASKAANTPTEPRAAERVADVYQQLATNRKAFRKVVVDR